ncbi:hypothetical protein DMN91_009868 [Ooceraea biroi]|uniref:Odorant receptor n=1 Tax=Ooceraea biroi TaxID=2015173 RepID=A0A3L8DBW3_OOCBI|nr:uncharacterized protein LOC113561426 isoform X2 [Ooceraea biroi]RLU17632.1 hypothetical protein DMN91_009868 [Ooceraea biroi]
MVFAGKRCFKLHRIMLLALGLWPYQESFIWRIQSVFFFGTYCCFIFFQFTPFLTTTCNMECIMKRFSYICITFAYVMNYYALYFNSKVVKQVLEHMQFDWKMFEKSDAMKIFEEYLSESYILALSLCSVIVLGAFGFIIIECRSIILDVIAPMNESRPRKLELDLELFVNEEQYFLLYFLQEIIGMGIGIWSIITTGTFLITIAKHSCASYKIVSYLMRNTVIYTLQLPVVQRIQFMHRNICLSVYIHRRTMEFCKGLLLSFDMWYFPLLLTCALSLSCQLFRLYNAIIQFNDLYDILVTCATVFCYFVYMIAGNFLGQTYTEHSFTILVAMYDSLWYVAPVPIQKLFLIMQKSIKSHKLVLGGLFTVSIEGFSTLVTTAVSYFTVIHAVRS